jgi:hypothetical protein
MLEGISWPLFEFKSDETEFRPVDCVFLVIWEYGEMIVAFPLLFLFNVVCELEVLTLLGNVR